MTRPTQCDRGRYICPEAERLWRRYMEAAMAKIGYIEALDEYWAHVRRCGNEEMEIEKR